MNSTDCSIVNGMLYPLIDQADAVAKTTGAWGPFVDFTTAQAIESYRMSEESANALAIADDGSIVLGEKAVKPVGIFRPSKVTLLPSGFSLYSWSDFENLQK